MEAVLTSIPTLTLNELLILKFDIDKEIERKKKNKGVVTIQEERLFEVE